MAIKLGDTLPDVTLKSVTADGVKDVSTKDFFAGRKVVLFALPGAFTPTCSAQHLPGFVSKAKEIKAKGIAEIACLSVNDAFVMEAWGKDQNALADVTLLADGSAAFTQAVGLTFDLTKGGLGLRSQRYALVADDGVVKILQIEEAGKFDVSSAEAVLAAL